VTETKLNHSTHNKILMGIATLAIFYHLAVAGGLINWLQYSSRSFISEGGPKNPLKGTSMKFLVSARGAQPWVDSGSKECRAIHNGMWAMTLHSRRLFRFLKAKVENLFTSYHMG